MFIHSLEVTLCCLTHNTNLDSSYSMGAAIVVDSRYVPSVYSRLQFNPLCFIQYENATLFPEEWKNVRTSITHP